MPRRIARGVRIGAVLTGLTVLAMVVKLRRFALPALSGTRKPR